MIVVEQALACMMSKGKVYKTNDTNLIEMEVLNS